jgi:hypothetical protein
MKLSEWSEKSMYSYASGPWGRRVIVRAITDLDTGEDPVVYATIDPGSREQPLVTIRVLAALTVGLATAIVTTDPTHAQDARMSIVIVPWSTIASTLRLEVSGDPDDRLTVVVTIGDETIEARRDERAALTEFYFEASRVANA